MKKITEVEVKHFFRLVCADCGQDLGAIEPNFFGSVSQIFLILDKECFNCHGKNLEVLVSSLRLKKIKNENN